MQIGTVGIVGAGTMGSGIAINLAQHGFTVRLTDIAEEAVQEAVAQARTFYARAVEKGRMSNEAAEAAADRLTVVDGPDDLEAADLVIEAVAEDREVKGRVLEELSPVLREEALVATNTSCLRVSDLARHLREPQRFLGLHYFSPAAVNPIVEVVKGEATSSAAVEAALAFCRASGKQPILCRDSYGFAINRFFCPYTNEAARARDAQLGSTGEIDAVAQEVLGAAAGPFAVMNLIKPRINLDAIMNLAPLGSYYEPSRSMVEVGQADRPFVITPVTGDIDPDRKRLIADHLLRGCFLPVLQALDEEVAQPADFDLGAREALRFGAGPCELMDRLGRSEVERVIQPALDEHGVPAPTAMDRIGRLAGGS